MNYYNYFTEIEEHFVMRRGKHLFVSPMDWSLMATWHDSGVPLHVALRGIDRAMDGFFAKQPRSDSRIGSLFYCHSAVMEEYTPHLESHLGEEPATRKRTHGTRLPLRRKMRTNPTKKRSGIPHRENS